MHSLTYGEITFEEMLEIVKNYISKDSKAEYIIAVGTDSQNFDYTKVPVTIGIHKIENGIGKGGIFFYDIMRVKKITNLHQKVLHETSLSIDLAFRVSETFEKCGIQHKIDVHADIGENGPTSRYITEIRGWVKACGFNCIIKPDSYMASSVANKLSK